MRKSITAMSFMAALSAVAVSGPAFAQGLPSLAGTYRCVPEPSSCQWQSPAPTISQSGSTVELNINKGELAEGKLTSSSTVSAGPPFNSQGRIMPDHSIEWSNGTKWVKQ